MLEIASIALTAFLTLSSNPLLLFNLITLPLLIHLSTTSTTPGAFVASAVPILATASTLRSLPTIHGLISSFFQAFLVQAAFSIAISIFVVLPITLTKLATSKIATLSHGQAAVVFGLLWAVAWLIWEGISPLGRYGIPSPLPDVAPILYIVRASGPTGLDIVLGTVSYAIFRLGTSVGAASGVGPPSPVSDQFRPLIAFPEDDDTAQPTTISGPRSPRSPRTSTVRLPMHERPPSVAVWVQIAVAVLLAISALPWLPEPLTLSSPLSDITPLSIGCLLGRTHQHHVHTLIHDSRPLGGHARLILWPESALEVNGKTARKDALNAVATELGKKYGALVAVGMESQLDDKRLNELVMVGPEGVLGEYSKQHLFPIIESYALVRNRQSVPAWSLPLSRPQGVPKHDWESRNITVSPLICLDSFHGALLRSKSVTPRPSLLVIPAAFPTLSIGIDATLLQVRMLAISHATPAFICSSTSGTRHASFAAYIDAWGRMTHFQAGGPSTFMTVPLPYYGGETRPATPWEFLGPYGVSGIALLFLIGSHFARAGWSGALIGRSHLADLTQRARLLVGARSPLVQPLIHVDDEDQSGDRIV